MFGFDRTIDGLNVNAQPITRQELNDEVRSYTKYAEGFSWEHASNPRLSYLVTPIGKEPSLSNLDRWYERDAGQRIGEFMFYRVRLRDEKLDQTTQLSNGDSATPAQEENKHLD
jgi:hypothetical protein